MLNYRQSLPLIICTTFLHLFSSHLFASTALAPVTTEEEVELTQIKTKYEQLQQAYNTLDTELAVHKQQLQELTTELQLQQTALDVLEAENQKLRESERNTFFIYGICAVLSGALLTLLIPRLRVKKRYSEWG